MKIINIFFVFVSRIKVPRIYTKLNVYIFILNNTFFFIRKIECIIVVLKREKIFKQ